MNVFRRLVFTAMIAGLITGGLVSLAQYFGTASLIARAEVFERAAEGAAPGHTHGDAAAPHTHGEASPAEWAPQDGIERTAYTVATNMLTAIAFSLLLVAAMELWGGVAGWRSGLSWGLAGFVAFTLAPGLGLPPELPGAEAAPLAARQLWWASTVAATAAGLALLFLQRRAVWVAAGVALLVLPHLVGAPRPAEMTSLAPASLAHEFVVVATITSLLFWAVLGALTGWFFQAMSQSSARLAMAGALGQRS